LLSSKGGTQEIQDFRNRRTPIAADPHHQVPGMQMQTLSTSGRHVFGNPNANAFLIIVRRTCPFLAPDHIFCTPKRTCKPAVRVIHPNRLIFQKTARHDPEHLRVRNFQSQLLRNKVDRRSVLDIRGGSDNRLTFGYAGNGFSKAIGPTQMTGNQADDVLPAFIQDHYRRVLRLVLQQRRNDANHNPGGHDENQRPVLAPQFRNHRPQSVEPRSAQSQSKTMSVGNITNAFRKACLDLQSQPHPITGDRNDGQGAVLSAEC
jgi:hypothetical protein